MATAELTVDVVAVAAEAREFAGLRRRAEECTAVAGWKIGQAWVAQAGGLRWLLTANGPGGRLAGLATAEALGKARTRIVVSVGLCGALDAQFEPGAVVQAGEVVDGHGAVPGGEVDALMGSQNDQNGSSAEVRTFGMLPFGNRKHGAC